MKRTTALSASLGLILCGSANAATRYVVVGGMGDCTFDWADACDLGDALQTAVSGDEIWVKAGTYSGSFYLGDGVSLIGGFDGTETAASQSDPATNATILDGGGTDRVLSISDATSGSTLLRGITIQNGNAGSSFEGGGGLLLEDSDVVVVDCVFKNNVAYYFGGGVVNSGANSTADFVNCVFHSNGDDKGTTSCGTNPFCTNPAHDDKPFGGGGVFLHGGDVTFTNCLFYGNIAWEGGGLFVVYPATAVFSNCTLSDNQATWGSGGGVFDYYGYVTVYNSVVWGNTAIDVGTEDIYNHSNYPATVTYSDVEGGFTGVGNINSDPLFTDSANGDYTIGVCSPCTNAANDADIPADDGDLDWDLNTTEDVPYDLAGNARTVSPAVDMGAYEYQVANSCCDDSGCGAGDICCSGVCTTGDCCDDTNCNVGVEVCCSNTCTIGDCCDNSDCFRKTCCVNFCGGCE